MAGRAKNSGLNRNIKMLCYPAILEQDSQTRAILVSFPDLLFAHSVGDDEAESLLNAEAALVTAFEICEEKREAIPMPSVAESVQKLVSLPVIVAGKVALYNAMLSESKRKSDMVRLLNIAPKLVDRLLSIRHKSLIELAIAHPTAPIVLFIARPNVKLDFPTVVVFLRDNPVIRKPTGFVNVSTCALWV
jgi:antitoxin HicB